MKKYLYLFVILMTFSSPAFGATVYKWLDQRGIVNFTDDLNKVPSAYRSRVETEVAEETVIPTPSAIPQAIALQKNEQVRTDIYGRDETWWKDKVRPWREALKEAEANLEKVNQKFIEEAAALSQVRYGSRTQVKFRILQLDRTNDERMKYEEKISEANQMLTKLGKEAEESKANMDWLK